MLDKYIDRIGEWNPQLFRELKSRLTGNAAIAVVAISIGLQAIAIGAAMSSSTEIKTQIWMNFFATISWLIPMGLILGSVYTLIADIDREEKRGTLNFIRLTPQSARSILIGKMLGVPSLIYLGVLLAIPLHLVVGLLAGIGLPMILVWYCTIGATIYLCSSLAILYSLYGGKYPIVFTLLFALPINTIVSLYNYYLNAAATRQWWTIESSFRWYWLPIINKFYICNALIITTILAISYWLWVTIDREYINPTSTAFKKEHSYWMNIQFQFWLLGFGLPILNYETIDNSSQNFYILATFYSIGTIGVYCLIPQILPSKLSMQEWSRYRRDRVTHKDRQWWQQELVRDLVWHDASPIGLAMLINVAISALVWGTCFGIFVSDRVWLIKSLCGVIIVSVLTLIHTGIINLIFLRTRAKTRGVMPLIILMSGLPLFLGFIATITLNHSSFGLLLFLFSPFAWMGVTQLALPNIGAIFMGQLGILAGITKLLQQRIKQLGRSETQTLSQQKSLMAGTNR
ncbi:hypothetical protein [Chamaesiphon minutus]|uniref:Uncharacterized protein n=1 Tax=Chamaesiphon minutus (strain ATCC 27169 / PCC 6605) TaxID=1173020 RepID=K9UK85_CHAP6|nr:hypothetical protein [Chamaesiphon minutus]AFY94614.1 hypothetical protein Cha6605_3631 [Chamaesiphon minutus PCC 6605]